MAGFGGVLVEEGSRYAVYEQVNDRGVPSWETYRYDENDQLISVFAQYATEWPAYPEADPRSRMYEQHHLPAMMSELTRLTSANLSLVQEGNSFRLYERGDMLVGTFFAKTDSRRSYYRVFAFYIQKTRESFEPTALRLLLMGQLEQFNFDGLIPGE